ncbi:hypothetical protein [Halorubrum tibetense]|uniref:DUF8106 domain-containing protein n=1 Tax=Halorubrum tibetense TaxID=175631 RepID=A0ABD5S8P0_9EURY
MPPTRSARPAPRSRSKTTLFCPECGHESDADGDWLVEEEPNGETHVCPVCGATIEVRTRLDPLAA